MAAESSIPGVFFTCPGTTSYGRGLSEMPVHSAGCCAVFTALDPQEQRVQGLRRPTYAHLGDVDPQIAKLARRQHDSLGDITPASTPNPRS